MAKQKIRTHGCEHCSAEYTAAEAAALVEGICRSCRFGYVRRVRWGLARALVAAPPEAPPHATVPTCPWCGSEECPGEPAHYPWELEPRDDWQA